MTFPHFLIIGGMKCGSTTLYRDLLTHPKIFFPIDKEPENLAHDDVLSADGRAAYEAMFAKASSDQLCAEASTGYTKRPEIDGVAERARTVLGGNLKIIYIVREPIARIRSHHHHEFSRGKMPVDIETAIESHPSLIDFSRYAWQLEPWLEAFGREQIRVVRFEDHMNARAASTAELCGWLGLEPIPERVQEERVFNKSDGNPILAGRWKVLRDNPVYYRLVRPLLSAGLRERLRRVLLPKAAARPDAISEATADKIRSELADDLRKLAEIMGIDGSVW